jgi:site-specific DNA-methyltransferase (adenine-specific)
MKLETWLIANLTADPQNARTHDKRNLDAIATSLTKFGQRKPIVITAEGIILAGNGTVQAAKQLKWKEVQVTITPKEWDYATARAYALADNRSAELAEWDTGVLSSQLLDLDAEGWDIRSLGFDIPEGEEDTTLNDAGPVSFEADYVPKAKLGDIYQMGNHRLICGDSLDVGTYEKLLGEETIDLVWTDPPYGVSYVGKTKDAMTIENDKLNTSELEAFLRDAFTAIVSFTKLGACWYVAAPPGPQFNSFAIPLAELGIWRQTIVWVKNTFALGHSDYHYRHEAIFYGWTPGAPHQAPPNRKQDSVMEFPNTPDPNAQDDVWRFPKPSRNAMHPTMKPVELIERAINNSSLPKQIVLDAFGGSGATLIACQKTNRTARIIELDPKYVDAIVERWEIATGKKAELVKA